MSGAKKRARLGDDGELPELIEAQAGELLYCTQCGTVNPADSRFCRKCGHSLEEQEADMIGLENLREGKRKHAEQEEKRHNAAGAVVLQIITMLSVAGLGITALVMEQGAALIPIILAWFLTETVRASSRKGITTDRVIIGIFTILLVCGLGLTALVMSQGAAIILLMLGWFLIETIRAHA
jgi:ribosomal protein L40E